MNSEKSTGFWKHYLVWRGDRCRSRISLAEREKLFWSGEVLTRLALIWTERAAISLEFWEHHFDFGTARFAPKRVNSGPVMTVVTRAIITSMVKMRCERMPMS